MKKIKLITLVLAGVAMLGNSGCETTKQEIKEPTIKKEVKAQPKNTEIIAEDIEVIERNDTTGRVSAAKEAARNLIADAKKQAIDLTRDAKHVYEIKKQEAEENAAQIIADARSKAKKEKAALIKQYLLDQKKATSQKVKAIVAKSKADASAMKDKVHLEIARILKEKTAQNKKITDKVIKSAKKSASNITKSSLIKLEKIKKETNTFYIAAKKYTKNKQVEADKYLTKKMKEADKAVETFTQKMMKEPKKPQSKEEKKADAILNKMLKSIPKDDYATFSADCTVDFKKRFNKKTFLATNKVLNEKLGPCTKTEYLGFLKKGPLTMYLWKANFEKTHKNNELVIRLTLGDLDKKPQVFAFDISMM